VYGDQPTYTGVSCQRTSSLTERDDQNNSQENSLVENTYFCFKNLQNQLEATTYSEDAWIDGERAAEMNDSEGTTESAVDNDKGIR